MKLVTFKQPVRGMGNPALVPDEVARDLEARGEIEADPPNWPAPTQPESPKQPEPARARFGRRVGRDRDLLSHTAPAFLTK